jgi:hypothetical protein
MANTALAAYLDVLRTDYARHPTSRENESLGRNLIERPIENVFR